MDDSLTVIIAPDSFTGSATATAAAHAIAQGWKQLRPHDSVTLLPQADGGEGTLDAIEAAVPDAVRHDAGLVTGPDGRPTPGTWLELPGQVGVVELAQCSGLPLMNTLDPLGATTRGLGEVIRHALGHGVESLIVGLGGSASTDGGAGALAALGLGLLNSVGGPLADGGAALATLTRVEKADLNAPPLGGVTLLADVISPLLGATGAATVFGPQKGADSRDIRVLEASLARFASLLGGDPDALGTGAAGGTAYGFATAWGARIEPGARVLQGLTGMIDTIGSADVILTGEGRFDATSLNGKVVGELLALAREHGVRAGVIAGQVSVGADAARLDGAESEAWSCSLTGLAGTAEATIADPMRYLEQAGREAARHFGATAP